MCKVLDQTLSNIPVIILAGGFGTRLSEETTVKPKPMVEIGGTPILVHIMRHYYKFGFRHFVICVGYKSWEIKQYFLNYSYYINGVSIDFENGHKKILSPEKSVCEKWKIDILETGLINMTGSRLAQAIDMLAESGVDTFATTYGDGVSDVDLRDEYLHHRENKKIATVLAVRPDARWGELEIASSGNVNKFVEKNSSKLGRINGGFFYFDKKVRQYLDLAPDCTLEKEPLENLAKDQQLSAYIYDGFWHAMDTIRDKISIEKVFSENKGPWKL